MLTADKAQVLFANLIKEKPERWVAAVQTLIVDALKSIEIHEMNIAKHHRAITKLVYTVRPDLRPKAKNQSQSAMGPAPKEASVSTAAPVSKPMTETPIVTQVEQSVEMTADEIEGSLPIDPDARAAELERIMDVASAAAEAEKQEMEAQAAAEAAEAPTAPVVSATPTAPINGKKPIVKPEAAPVTPSHAVAPAVEVAKTE